jgi:hypothetical protein
MGLKKLAAKVAEYQERLAAGHAKKIEPEHVKQVLDKLRRKEADLLVRLATETDEAERADVERKLHVAREHIERAEWLRRELG